MTACNQNLSESNQQEENQKSDDEQESKFTIAHYEKVVEDDSGTYLPWSLYVSDEKPIFNEKGVDVQDDKPITTFNVYIYDEIISSEHYTELFYLLRSFSGKPVQIKLYINSPGGDLDTLAAFLSVLESCDAPSISYVDSRAASAAFILALATDYTVFYDFAMLMAHNMSVSISGKESSSMIRAHEATKNSYKYMLEKYGSKILTKAEIKSILNKGAELWFDAEQCKERYNKYLQSVSTEE